MKKNFSLCWFLLGLGSWMQIIASMRLIGMFALIVAWAGLRPILTDRGCNSVLPLSFVNVFAAKYRSVNVFAMM